MRMLLGIAVLAAATPAAAQERGLPLWMVGEWCPRAPPEGLPLTTGNAETDAINLRYELGDIGMGAHCIAWSANPNATMTGRQTFGYSGRNDSLQALTISVVRGRLRYDRATAYAFYMDPKPDGRFREVSRGAQEIVFERVGRGSPWRIGYRREGDRLIIESVEEKGGEPWRRTYSRNTR